MESKRILRAYQFTFLALHGPVTYMDKKEKYDFLDLVSKVVEAGGGDCDELAINGIRDIFASPLQYRSPIYVLTDAGAKDATEEHLDAVKEMIINYKTPINFFLSNAGRLDLLVIDISVLPIQPTIHCTDGNKAIRMEDKFDHLQKICFRITYESTSTRMQNRMDLYSSVLSVPIFLSLLFLGCLTEEAINVYKSLARYSGGQILYFSDKRQIASTTTFIQKGLVGGSAIPVTPNRFSKRDRKKRGVVELEYSITVDDSIDVLSTAIMDRSNVDAQLYSPGKRCYVLCLGTIIVS